MMPIGVKAVIARFTGLDFRKDRWRTASSAAGTFLLRVGIEAVPISLKAGEQGLLLWRDLGRSDAGDPEEVFLFD